jgi:hypothetical protein
MSFSDLQKVAKIAEEKKAHSLLQRVAEASSDSGDIIQLQSQIKNIFDNLHVFIFPSNLIWYLITCLTA